MGIPANHPAILQAIQRGLIRAEDLTGANSPAPSPTDEPVVWPETPKLVASVFVSPGTWLVPVATASETNQRD